MQVKDISIEEWAASRGLGVDYRSTLCACGEVVEPDVELGEVWTCVCHRGYLLESLTLSRVARRLVVEGAWTRGFDS